MASLKAIELKFLLSLVSFDEYRSSITKVKPNSSTPASDRDKACESLVSQGYVECDREISKFAIAGPGKELLKNADRLPVKLDPQEQKILEACSQAITPGTLGKKVPASDRQPLLRSLVDRGLIKASQESIKEVWLSAQGKRFLQEAYVPEGNWGITASKVGAYVKFLRESVNRSSARSLPTSQPRSQQPLSQPGSLPNSNMPIGSQTKPDKQAILQQIQQLEQMLETDNYLPIFYLRDKLQPPLTREDLDSALYGLQRESKIELSSIHNQGKYSDKQLADGIRQEKGNYLFFISVL